jgi:hypothetical protein
VQIYPAATGTEIKFNTVHDNGMGIHVGGAINKDGCSVCYPENTTIPKNIVTDSRAGHDSRYTSQSPPPVFNIYSHETSGYHNNVAKANNCVFLTYNGTGGYAHRGEPALRECPDPQLTAAQPALREVRCRRNEVPRLGGQGHDDSCGRTSAVAVPPLGGDRRHQ